MISNILITLLIIIFTIFIGYISLIEYKVLFCIFTKKHYRNHKYIYLPDIIFDKLNDNDDLDDTPTIIKVEYCEYCGHIFNITREGSIYDLASFGEIKQFEKITKCNADKLTLAEDNDYLF